MLKKRILLTVPLISAYLASSPLPLDAHILPLFGHAAESSSDDAISNLEFPVSKILRLDNCNYGDINDLLDDPLTILRAQFPYSDEEARISAAWDLAAKMFAEDDFTKDLGPDFIPLSLHPQYKNFETDAGAPSGKVVNQSQRFSYVKPSFDLELIGKGEEILWKITTKIEDAQTTIVEGIANYANKIELTELQSTFIAPNIEYQFEFRVITKNGCQGWSTPFTFVYEKPSRPRLVEFEKVGKKTYEISWTPGNDDPEVQYFVFASNSRDFIPSVYFDKQIKSLENGKPSQYDDNTNLIQVVSQTKITIDGAYAYYRVIAEKNGCFSNPTPLIYVYDTGLKQNRDVLAYDAKGKTAVRRSLDMHGLSNFRNNHSKSFVKNKYISDYEWSKAEPFLIPDNHPMTDRLDRIFLRRRATQDAGTMRKAGFAQPEPRGLYRPVVSRHRILEGHMVKLFLDSQTGINDANRLTKRAAGAQSIAEAIKRLGYENIFKVPKKYLYPLPETPEPHPSLERKKFVLLTRDMGILGSDSNRKKWKSSKITHEILDAVFELFEDQGLADSTFAFNIPFDHNGYIAIIDTEVHHTWPVPYEKFAKYLSSSNQQYWSSITKHRRMHK